MEKTIWDLKLHETLFVVEKLPLKPMQTEPSEKRYEVTRVPGGWVYSFDYPAFRQSPIVFVPYFEGNEYIESKKQK